jgi:serine/threonine protein kinase
MSRTPRPPTKKANKKEESDSKTLGNHYLLQKKLGSGSYGDVYIAQDTRNGTEKAVKVIKQKSKSLTSAFLREVTAVKKLEEHPNVAPIDDILIDKKLSELAIVMPLAKNNLFHYIQYEAFNDPRGPKNIHELIHFAYDILCGLAHIHLNELLHLDLKPENILVFEDASGGLHPKISDFGMVFRQGSHIGYPLQTLWWRAPELTASAQYSRKYLIEAVDIFSYGIILLDLFFGFTPFQGKNEEAQLHLYVQFLGVPGRDWFRKYRASSSIQEMSTKWRALYGSVKAVQMDPEGILQSMYGIFKMNKVKTSIGKSWNHVIHMIFKCLHMDPEQRPKAADLLDDTLWKQVELPHKCVVQKQELAVRSGVEQKHWNDMRQSVSDVFYKLLKIQPTDDDKEAVHDPILNLATHLLVRFVQTRPPETLKKHWEQRHALMMSVAILLAVKVLYVRQEDESMVKELEETAQKLMQKNTEEWQDLEMHMASNVNFNFDGHFSMADALSRFCNLYVLNIVQNVPVSLKVCLRHGFMVKFGGRTANIPTLCQISLIDRVQFDLDDVGRTTYVMRREMQGHREMQGESKASEENKASEASEESKENKASEASEEAKPMQQWYKMIDRDDTEKGLQSVRPEDVFQHMCRLQRKDDLHVLQVHIPVKTSVLNDKGLETNDPRFVVEMALTDPTSAFTQFPKTHWKMRPCENRILTPDRRQELQQLYKSLLATTIDAKLFERAPWGLLQFNLQVPYPE